ncbi:MAG TPA: DUF1501 domain-containing protein [Planctomycetaceae bacterium]|nr:DUF1501 domain-containing protein [Planctomycetaceae bacterium]
MLNILGPGSRFCDGVSRRSFLSIGSLAMGGMGLREMLAAESVQGVSRPHKATIMILLPGGPPHQDMVDLKPTAPKEIRGPFQPIRTNVPGIDLSEMMPRTAAIMDKMAIVRSLYGGLNDHNIHINLTGWETHPQMGDSPHRPGFPTGGWPSLGAVVSKVHGPVHRSMPPFISLSPPNAESTTRASLNQPGFLGVGHAGFETNRRKRDDIVYKSGVSREQVAADAESGADITLRGISLDRLGDRTLLLKSFDRFRRNVEAGGVMDGMDMITQQALGILTSSRLAKALDFRLEPADLVRRYGISDAAKPVHGGPELLKQFLVATRLVEAGCRCVTLAFSQWPLERMSRGGFNWDWHKENFPNVRATVPMLDIGLSAMVEDLHARGLADDVSVVVWGEFGRTPKINGNGGRDHWPNANMCIMAGGGMRTGQVVGSTNRLGEVPKDRPVHYREVFATLYHNMGIVPESLTLDDLRGRPQYVVDQQKPIGELV